ncbi:MAG: BLUF domain-containing protein [Alphaproteobacteria bacterium]|nr:BLUF domain-containing protein [Alphaproteobacteria bacterium]
MEDVKGSAMEQLVYVSRSVRSVNSAIGMSDILAEARPNNARDGITGCLTAIDGRFVQVIEGESGKLDDLINRLLRDERHTELRVLERRTVAGRAFPQWDMLSPVLVTAEIDDLRRLMRDDSGGRLDDFIGPLQTALARQSEVLHEARTLVDGPIPEASNDDEAEQTA